MAIPVNHVFVCSMDSQQIYTVFTCFRHYKVNLVALSANPEYSDSGKSNTLSINTSLYSPREGEAMDEITYTDDHDIPVKVTKVTETSIHLDWGNFLETEGVGCYKITWSSVAQPAVSKKRLC